MVTALDIDPSREGNLSNEYMQKKILHNNRQNTETDIKMLT